MSDQNQSPAVSEAMREAVARPSLFEQLREAAQQEAAAHRLFTDMRHGPHYEAMKPENTLSWKAASEIARLTGDLKAAEDQNEALIVKLAALAPHGSCACSYDHPNEVCAHHSPALTAAEAALSRLQADRDAEVGKLRAALKKIAAGAPTEEPHPWDGELDTVCWNTAQIARAALTETPEA